MTLLGGTSDDLFIDFGDRSSISGRIGYNNNNKIFRFYTNGNYVTAALTLNNDNTVQIGGGLSILGNITRNTRDLSITVITDYSLTTSDDIVFLTTTSSGDIILPAASVLNDGRIIDKSASNGYSLFFTTA